MIFLKGILILGTLSASFAFFSLNAGAENRDTMITSFNGEVEIRKSQTVAWQKVEKGLVIQPGNVIRTGAKSWATLRHNSAKIQLFENTLLEFPKEQSSQQVREGLNNLVTVVLQKGHSIFKVFENRLKGRFEVISPKLMAGVKGTVFEVFEKEAFSGVAVSEGVVEVINLDFRNEVIEVRAKHYTELFNGHLTPPKEHRGEDLLLKEPHSWEKPGEVRAIKSDLRDKPLKASDHAEAFKEDLKAESQDVQEDLKNTRQSMLEDLRDTQKSLVAELKEDNKALSETLREEQQELEAEIREDTQATTAEVRDDTQTAAEEVIDDTQDTTSELSSTLNDLLN